MARHLLFATEMQIDPLQSQVTPKAQTTSGSQRHGLVDALRGFALLGILLVNIEFIVAPSETGWLHYDSDVDIVVRWLVAALGQTKVYPLFALLFGYGLWVQLVSAKRRNQPLWPRYRRRLVGLCGLGVLHGVLFFPGDILLIYAAVGALAYRFRDAPTNRLLTIAKWVYAAAALFWLAVGLLLTATNASPQSAPEDSLRILSEGTFGEVVVLHFFYWLATLAILVVIQGPAVFACFLAGIALARTTLLSDPHSNRPTFLRAMRWFPVGLIGAGLGATLTVRGGRWDTLGFAIGFAFAPLVAAGYLSLLALTIGKARGLIAGALRAAGRMSLTVYLLESVIASTFAYGYGFGLFGRTSPLQGVGLALGIWLALSAISVVWMRVLRFGPFEWALRSFTYRELQPLRR